MSGMTQPGLMVTINEAGLPAEIVEELKNAIDANFMGQLCGAVKMPSDPVPLNNPHQRLGR